jgi:hypothetical protein
MPSDENLKASAQRSALLSVAPNGLAVLPISSPDERAVEKVEPIQGNVAVFLLADITKKHRLWGYARFILQGLPMKNVRGLVFSKMMGSGFDGGFGLKPSASRQALFCLFADEDSADAFLQSDTARGYEVRSSEFCIAKLRAYSCRGTWSGHRIGVTAAAPNDGPIATLTRASIRPLKARAFWRMQPASEVSLSKAQGCIFATGIGEAPILRQATFSLWRDVGSMDDYARSGAHLDAIRAAHAGNFFSESMFVRFLPITLKGNWRGRHYE